MLFTIPRYIPTDNIRNGTSGLKIVEQINGDIGIDIRSSVTLSDIKEFFEQKKIKNFNFSTNMTIHEIFMRFCILKSHNFRECDNEILRYLSFCQGFDVNEVEKTYGNTALMWCCANGGVDICLKLINELEADPFIPDKYGKNALHFLVVKGHTRQIPVVKLILANHGIRNHVNDRMADGMTALHIACARRDWRYIKPLLNAGADKYAKDNEGRTPMDILKLSDIERLKIIIEYFNSVGTIRDYDSFVNSPEVRFVSSFNKKIFYTNPKLLADKMNKNIVTTWKNLAICGIFGSIIALSIVYLAGAYHAGEAIGVCVALAAVGLLLGVVVGYLAIEVKREKDIDPSIDVVTALRNILSTDVFNGTALQKVGI